MVCECQPHTIKRTNSVNTLFDCSQRFLQLSSLFCSLLIFNVRSSALTMMLSLQLVQVSQKRISMANETCTNRESVLSHYLCDANVLQKNCKQLFLFLFLPLGVHIVYSLCIGPISNWISSLFFADSTNESKKNKIKIKSESNRELKENIHQFMCVRQRNAATKEPVLRIRLLMSTSRLCIAVLSEFNFMDSFFYY